MNVKVEEKNIDDRLIILIKNPCPLIFRFCGSFFVSDLYVLLHIASKTSPTSSAEHSTKRTRGLTAVPTQILQLDRN